MRSRVIPGSSVTMERRCPISRLNSVDLPTFGRPKMAMSGSEADMRCSDGSELSLPFWKIPHQMLRDLIWLPMSYSRTHHLDRKLKTMESEAVRGFVVLPRRLSSDFLLADWVDDRRRAKGPTPKRA